MRLWLDDLRPIPEDFDRHAFTAVEAIQLIGSEPIELISFDHDLGPEPLATGYDVAKHIEKLAYDRKIGRMEWRVHSANPSGASNIRAAMESAERFWAEDEAIRAEMSETVRLAEKMKARDDQ